MADVLQINTKDKTVTDRNFTQAELNETEDPVKIKTMFKKEIDRQAELERLKYITPGAGQAMSYAEKRDEAKRAILEHAPDQADYPTLAADLGITANTIKEVAAIVLAINSQWLLVNKSIERTRLMAKKRIDDGEDPATVMGELDWSIS